MPTGKVDDSDVDQDQESKLAELTKALDHERKKRSALSDRIARALAALDPDPDPEVLDLAVQYCRICRLLLERYRAAAALVEQDPEQLAEAGTREVVLALHRDLQRHHSTSGHDPMFEVLAALVAIVER